MDKTDTKNSNENNKIVKKVENYEIFTSHLNSLNPGNMIIDTIVDAYIHLQINAIPQNWYVKSCMLNSTFAQVYNQAGLEGVSNFPKVRMLNKYDFVLIPICQDFHWYLIVVDFCRRIILEIESLQRHDARHIRKYAVLIESIEADNGVSLKPFKLYKPVDLPTQVGNDCGAHVCLYSKIMCSGEGDIPHSSFDKYRNSIKSEILNASNSKSEILNASNSKSQTNFNQKKN